MEQLWLERQYSGAAALPFQSTLKQLGMGTMPSSRTVFWRGRLYLWRCIVTQMNEDCDQIFLSACVCVPLSLLDVNNIKQANQQF